jgi:hypothetical protein
VGIDTNSVVAGQYGVSSYPTTVLIGADGRIAVFQIGGIENADVVFGSIMKAQIDLIRQSRGIDRLAYETGLTNQVSPLTGSKSSPRENRKPEIRLDGPAKAFAERMKCPACGGQLYTCGCGLCDGVKKRLSTMTVTNKTDDQILHELFLEAKSP